MTPERWERVKNILGPALDLSPAERPSYLDQSCAGDDQLRREVERLLHREQDAGSEFLAQTSLAQVAAAVLPEEDNRWVGRRVGSYQIVEQIGVGGMGEVYRAFRADDQYRKEVALKVVRTGQDSGSVISRFKNERQILAGLEHPHIARLLDGGSTTERTPYLVMELIEGQSIGQYCDAHKLSIADRLQLFLKICVAVQYAHQRLVIHRDIKPSNILVTSDGTPKLLDFGIAKVLGADSASQANETLTAFRALTPEYASPEQIAGEVVTTASDVYSLGVVLYDLLTGRGPYPTTRNPQELATLICDREPDKPSLALSRAATRDGATKVSLEEIAAARGSTPYKLQKQLNGDLDNIVLMALRKEPSRRYGSAEQFAADIRRHLDNLPVEARKDTTSYRISKFVTRHKAVVLASAVVVLAIVAGLAAALYEAHVARQQAENARVQRARAERRFNDVRKLANSLMFEIHDSIRDLPGALPARKVLVSRAVEYLDSLSQEATGDISLQRELASAYDRVGDLMGYTGAANLGDFSGALQSYKKALAIREAAAAAAPDDATVQSDLLNEYFRLSFVLLDRSDPAGALTGLRKGLPVAQKLAATQSDPKYGNLLAGFYWRTGSIQNETGDYTHAAESFRQAAAIREPLAKVNPWFRAQLAADYLGLAKALGRTGDVNHGLEAGKRGVQLLSDSSHFNTTNATFREYLGEAYLITAPLLEKTGNADQSLECYRSANRIFHDLSKANPTDSLAKNNFGFSTIGIAKALLQKHEIQPAITLARQAVAISEGIESKNRYQKALQGESYLTLGMAYEALGGIESSEARDAHNLHRARVWLTKSLRAFQEDIAMDSSSAVDADRARTELAKCDSALSKM